MQEAAVIQALDSLSRSGILILKRFRTAWPIINQNKFSTISSNPDSTM